MLGPVDSDNSGKTMKSTHDAKKPTPQDKNLQKSDLKEDLQVMDQKWSERLKQLEALIISKFGEQATDQPTF